MKQSDDDVLQFLSEYPAPISDLGVVYGALLPDPNGLLEGPGKQHRYVAFAKPADLEKAGLKDLLRAAVTAWKERSKQTA